MLLPLARPAGRGAARRERRRPSAARWLLRLGAALALGAWLAFLLRFARRSRACADPWPRCAAAHADGVRASAEPARANSTLLMTTYLTTKPQPQADHAQPLPDQLSFIRPWYESVLALGGARSGMAEALVFHDALSEGFVAAHAVPGVVRFVRVPNEGTLSNNDVRYAMALSELLAAPPPTGTLCALTDGADVRVPAPPHEVLGGAARADALLVGSERIGLDDGAAARADRALAKLRALLGGGAFAPRRFDAAAVEAAVRSSGRLLNPGVLGGRCPVVRLALCLALGAMGCADARSGGFANANTPAFNGIGHTYFRPFGRLLTGPPLHSRFGAHEGGGGEQGEARVAFVHK